MFIPARPGGDHRILPPPAGRRSCPFSRSFTATGRRLNGTINEDDLVERVLTWVTNPLFGDAIYDHRYTGYQGFGGVMFPTVMPAERILINAGEFPGCRAVRTSREEIDDYGRVEYWDAATEIAMVCDGVSVYHEHPSQRVAHMATLIAVTRGSPIETFGHADLLLRDEHGERRRIMQADQTVYLHPERDRPAGSAMVVGEDTLPDVIVEVDHTTDVRRRKLALYESWGLPEVWVELPDADSPSRATSRAPGLTIHVLHPDGFYRQSAESRAFPGWTAAEIHRSMNEATLSIETMAVFERVARALRDQDGAETGDAPFLHRMRVESHAAGRADGHAAGRAEGRAESLAEQRTPLTAARRRSARHGKCRHPRPTRDTAARRACRSSASPSARPADTPLPAPPPSPCRRRAAWPRARPTA